MCVDGFPGQWVRCLCGFCWPDLLFGSFVLCLMVGKLNQVEMFSVRTDSTRDLESRVKTPGLKTVELF